MFKKLIIKLTIKLLNFINNKDFGEFDKSINKAINVLITKLENLIKDKK